MQRFMPLVTIALSLIYSSNAFALYNGTQSSEPQGIRASTLAIETPEGLCTGTLIGPSLILTAAHCVSQKGRYRVHYLDANFKPRTLSVKRVAQHPDFDEKDGFSTDDIGLVQTTSAVASDMKVIKLPGFFSFSSEGDVVLIAGFGSTERKNMRDGVLREAVMRAVPPSISKMTFAGLQSDSDVKIGMCVGDSGGPVYKSDLTRVVGILKGGTTEPNQECTANPIFTPVRPYTRWIKMVAERWGVSIGE